MPLEIYDFQVVKTQRVAFTHNRLPVFSLLVLRWASSCNTTFREAQNWATDGFQAEVWWKLKECGAAAGSGCSRKLNKSGERRITIK
jgi:hypothetical protein